MVTYSPKYARYQKTIRDAQVERAKKMIKSGSTKKQRKNPNDPARFIGTQTATEEGEVAKIIKYLDEDKIATKEQYDGLYAVCTDLLDDDVRAILNVSEGRWQIEECRKTVRENKNYYSLKQRNCQRWDYYNMKPFSLNWENFS